MPFTVYSRSLRSTFQQGAIQPRPYILGGNGSPAPACAPSSSGRSNRHASPGIEPTCRATSRAGVRSSSTAAADGWRKTPPGRGPRSSPSTPRPNRRRSPAPPPAAKPYRSHANAPRAKRSPPTTPPSLASPLGSLRAQREPRNDAGRDSPRAAPRLYPTFGYDRSPAPQPLGGSGDRARVAGHPFSSRRFARGGFSAAARQDGGRRRAISPPWDRAGAGRRYCAAAGPRNARRARRVAAVPRRSRRAPPGLRTDRHFSP